MAAWVSVIFQIIIVKHVLGYLAPRYKIDDIGEIPDDTLWKARGIIGTWKSKAVAKSGKVVVPTRQPFTRSQAEQICATSKIPRNVFLSAGSMEDSAFGGRWMTRDGAQLVQWSEDPLAWQRGTLRLNVAGTLLASVVPVEPDDDEIKQRWKERIHGSGGVKLQASLRASLRQSKQDTALSEPDTVAVKKKLLAEMKVVLRDCDDQHLYTLWATTRFPKSIEIYNRDDTLLARGEEVDPALLGQPTKQRHWEFKDAKGKRMAKAATPQLDDIRRGPPLADGVVPWEMLFTSEDLDPDSIPRVLAAPNERWVIVAALQWRAFEDMQKPQHSSLVAAFPPPLVMICIIIFAIGLCFLTRLLFSCIFDLVYPPRRNENHSVYLYEWVNDLYGELIQKMGKTPRGALIRMKDGEWRKG